MRNATLCLIFAGVLALLATPALGKTIVVRPGDSIQDAVDSAAEGDKILIKRGIYSANVTVDTNRLRFVGQGRVVWDGSNRSDDHCLSGKDVDDTLVQNILFVNGRDQVHLDGDRTTIRRCGFGFSGEDAIDLEGENIKVERCRFRGIEWRPIWIDGDGAVVQRNDIRGALDNPEDDEFAGIVVRGRGPVIQRNTVKQVDGRGIMILGRDSGSSNDKDGDGGQILNNRITNTQDDAIRAGAFEDNVANEVIIRGNRVTSSHEDGIEVDGDGALVERNTLRNTRREVIEIDGHGARVLRNRCIDSANGEGILIYGDDATVADNFVSNTRDECIDVNGDRCQILRNRVSNSFDNDGIEVDGLASDAAQGCLIEGNTVTDCVDEGLSLDIANSTVRRNVIRDVATRCSDHGIKLNYGDNTVENNMVTGAAGIGILIGDVNQIVRNNVVRDCGLDGILLWGSGHELTRNTVRGCDAEGLQNSADDVTITRCTFQGNRIDVANDGTVTNDTTFDADNNYQSGGLDRLPEIDCVVM